MKKSRKLITIISLCLVIAALCSMAAFAAETRARVMVCPSCGWGDVVLSVEREPATLTHDCQHYQYGHDVETGYYVTESGTCDSCGAPYSDYYFESVKLVCYGYNA